MIAAVLLPFFVSTLTAKVAPSSAPFEILFSANKVFMSAKGKVNEPGNSELYSLNLETKKIHKVASSHKNLNYPRPVANGKLLAIESTDESVQNSLVIFDRKSGKRTETVQLPGGVITRVNVMQNGKFVFVYYFPKKEYYGRIMDPVKIVVLRDFKPFYTANSVLDTTLDSDGKSIVTVAHREAPVLSILDGQPAQIPIGLPMSKGVRNVATDEKGTTLAFSIFDKGNDWNGKFFVALATPNDRKMSPFELTASDDASNCFESFYGCKLWYDARLKLFLLEGIHGMSDGFHPSTVEIDPTKKSVSHLCYGNYIATNSASKIVTLIRPWLGPYKRGGKRIGRIMEWTEGTETGRPYTPQDLDVGEAIRVDELGSQSL